jgi:hypothetical protein
VWYRWRAPRTIPVIFSTCGAGFDTVLGVFRGTAVNALAQIAMNDDGCGSASRLSSRLTFRARSGQIYYIAVAGLGRTGVFPLRWEAGRCRVPAVVGLMVGQARRAIVRAGCRVGPVRTARSVLPPRGVILAQWPNAGAELPSGGAVHLLVSLGPR